MNKLQQIIMYRMLVAAIRCKKDYDFSQGQKRFIFDLTETEYLWYYPSSGKIQHSKLGVIFRNEEFMWCLEPELKEIFNQIIQ